MSKVRVNPYGFGKWQSVVSYRIRIDKSERRKQKIGRIFESSSTGFKGCKRERTHREPSERELSEMKPEKGRAGETS